ncbi:MAG TPA: hypothetical protein PK668_08055 [Myxococcota bacterium]|nr:hypothetical protein [Myxococcota bacterium]HRY93072.1 hypothetical protein [Myxococcota bacterium]HSA20077.1 hypothetical protein [Myxococcota bacterium]
MGEDRLGELLRGLPAERAPADFTGRVLARLDARPGAGSTRLRRRLALGLLAAGVLAAALLLWTGREAARRSELRAELDSLRRETQALERALARPRERLVYLGEDERADYVMDLGQVEAAGGVLPVPLTAGSQGGVL